MHDTPASRPSAPPSDPRETRTWKGSWNNWFAPFHACPNCGASLNWGQHEDVFDRPVLDASCSCGIHFGAPLEWHAVAPAPRSGDGDPPPQTATADAGVDQERSTARTDDARDATSSWYPATGTHAAATPPTLLDRLRWFDYASNEYEAAEKGSEREAHFKQRYAIEHAAIVAMFAAGEQDTARLNWLQDHAAHVEPLFSCDPEEPGWRVRSEESLDFGEGDTLREAIDFASRGATDSLAGVPVPAVDPSRSTPPTDRAE